MSIPLVWHTAHSDIMHNEANKAAFLWYLIDAFDTPSNSKHPNIIICLELAKMMAYYHKDETLFTKDCLLTIKKKLI